MIKIYDDTKKAAEFDAALNNASSTPQARQLSLNLQTDVSRFSSICQNLLCTKSRQVLFICLAL